MKKQGGVRLIFSLFKYIFPYFNKKIKSMAPLKPIGLLKTIKRFEIIKCLILIEEEL